VRQVGGGLLVGVQAALVLNPSLVMLLLSGVQLSNEAGHALCAGLAARPPSAVALTLVIGFNAMAPQHAARWARSLHELQRASAAPASDGRTLSNDPRITITDQTGGPLTSEAAIGDALNECKADWVDERLFAALLQSAVTALATADAPTEEGGSKFTGVPSEMVFDDELTFKDGIYGLYKRRGCARATRPPLAASPRCSALSRSVDARATASLADWIQTGCCVRWRWSVSRTTAAGGWPSSTMW
jgi:hypothetical protein